MNTQSKVDLSKATARPWQVTVEHDEEYDPWRIEILTQDVLQCDSQEQAIANAALIVQAVNSFEAMREALIKAQYALSTFCGPGNSVVEEIEAALALAEGKS